MTTFSAHTSASDVVRADRDAVWAVLTDPAQVASMTPFVTRITPRGEHWIWEMGGLEVLGRKVSPTFTERMTLTPQSRIDFTHDPPEGRERAGVEGIYELEDADDGTLLTIDLTICVDLPLPRAAGPAVRATMKGVMGTIGDRFAKNFLNRLGA
ncbi:SRPBCC family protein [Nocardioides sp. SYSU D00038]|uniref:SRPBCC family protein n=1 Tax=Nocardioides sp. SYSU D00038 TaxID=2812554 RepID=UPI001967CCD6|nr:SRPBCC family protein [Nocardioides sp. SYSU D00038]